MLYYRSFVPWRRHTPSGSFTAPRNNRRVTTPVVLTLFSGRKKHHGGNNHILAAGVLGTVGAAILSALAGKALFASVLAFALAVANLFRSWGGGSSSHGRISTCASPESAATAAILDLNGRKVDLDKYSAIIGVKRSGDAPVGIPVGTLHEIVYKAQSGGSTGAGGGYPHYVTAGGETVQWDGERRERDINF
jgi:hypothetical protein